MGAAFGGGAAESDKLVLAGISQYEKEGSLLETSPGWLALIDQHMEIMLCFPYYAAAAAPLIRLAQISIFLGSDEYE